MLGGGTDDGEVKPAFEYVSVGCARPGEASESLFMVSRTRIARIIAQYLLSLLMPL